MNTFLSPMRELNRMATNQQSGIIKYWGAWVPCKGAATQFLCCPPYREQLRDNGDELTTTLNNGHIRIQEISEGVGTY